MPSLLLLLLSKSRCERTVFLKEATKKKSTCKIILCRWKLQKKKKNTTQKPNARVPPPQTLNQYGLGAPRRRWFISNRSSKKTYSPSDQIWSSIFKWNHGSLLTRRPAGRTNESKDCLGWKKKYIHIYTVYIHSIYRYCHNPPAWGHWMQNLPKASAKSYQSTHLLPSTVINIYYVYILATQTRTNAHRPKKLDLWNAEQQQQQQEVS